MPERYVHRIGRTARAGREGHAISLCSAEQRAWLRDIEKDVGQTIPVFFEHEYHSEAARHSTMRGPVLGGGNGRGQGHRGGGQRGGAQNSNRRTSGRRAA